MNKLLKKISVILSILVVAIAPTIASAAWIATDNFDSYSAGASLNTVNGGTNWTAAWVAVSATSETAPAGMTGISGKVTGATGTAHRPFTSATGVTEMYFRIRANETNLDHRIGIQENGVAERIQVTFNSAGNIVGNGTTIQAYSANTTYVVGLKWGHNGTNYAVSINGGAYSADIAISGGSTTMNNIYFDTASSAGTYYVDDISVGPYVAVTTTPDFGTITLFGDW